MSDTEKAALIAELDAARAKIAHTGAALSEAGDGVRQAFDIPGRAKRSYEKHRPAWLGGAALFGLLLAKLPARKRTVFVEAADAGAGTAGKLRMVWSAVKFAGGFAKPFLGELVANWITSRTEKPPSDPNDQPRG